MDNGNVAELTEQHKKTAEKNAANPLHTRIANAYRQSAIPAFSPKVYPTDDRNVVVPADQVLAMGAMRRRMDDAFPTGQTMNNHIQKTPDAGSEHDKPKEAKHNEAGVVVEHGNILTYFGNIRKFRGLKFCR